MTSKAEFVTLMAKTASNIGLSSFRCRSMPTRKKPISALYLGQGGLGMPDRDYYLADRLQGEEGRVPRPTSRGRLSLIDAPDAGGDRQGRARLRDRDRQGQLAERRRRDIDKVYNPMTIAAAAGLRAGLRLARVSRRPRACKGVDAARSSRRTPRSRRSRQIFDKTPLETLKAWEAFHVVDGASPYLSKRFVDSRVRVHGKALSGTPSMRPRWKRGVEPGRRPTSASARQGLRRPRTSRRTSKAKMDELVANLKTAMAARIED